jgi:hypothetical protein
MAGPKKLLCGALVDDKLAQELNGQDARIHAAADCRKPRNLVSAMREGAAIAQQI